MGLEPSKSSKLIIFHINLPKKVYPLKNFLQNLAWGRESQVRTLTPNLPFWVGKCGMQPEKSLKLVILVYICPKGVYPLHQFLQNLAWGRVSQVHTITLTFTFVALKMWPYGRQNRKNSNFWYKFAPKKSRETWI